MLQNVLCQWVRLAAGLSVFACSSAFAGMMIELESSSTTYTPGTPIRFTVELPEIFRLGEYQIDIVMTSSSGMAGTDFWFDQLATLPPDSGYVFSLGALGPFSAGVSNDFPERLVLRDFDLLSSGPVNPTINSSVAVVVVETLPTFTGPLSFHVDTDQLQLLTLPSLHPAAANVSEFTSIQNATAASDPLVITAAGATSAPEPGSLTVLAMFAVAVGYTGYRRRKLPAHSPPA